MAPLPTSSDYIFGRWPVKEALEAGHVNKLFLAQNSNRSSIKDLLTLARKSKIPFHWVEKRRLDQMVSGHHQGVVAQVAALSTVALDTLWDKALKSSFSGPRLLFCDGVLDPQNLGSILRTAVFFGVCGVVIPKWRAAPLTNAVVRASAGAASLIPIAQVSNLATTLEMARKKGFWLVGADLEGGVESKKADIPQPFGLVLGSEGAGLHRLVREKCDYLVYIGRKGQGLGIGSLNVSVAAAILIAQFS